MEMKEGTGALVREILEMARSDSAAIVSAAEAEAAALLAAAAGEAERESRARVEAARAAAAQRSLLLMTALPLETERLRAERLESLLREVKGKAAAALAEKAAGGCGTVNAALAAEALRGMEGNSFTLTLPAGSGSPADLAPEVKRLSGKDGLQLVFLEDGGLAGGAIARDAAGRQYWDNSFKARLERFWPELRGALGAGLAGGRKNDRA